MEDSVLKVLKPKLVGSIHSPVSPPKVTSNQLEALYSFFQLLRDAVFKVGAFDAQTLLECNHDRVIKAGRLLFEKLIRISRLLWTSSIAIAKDKEEVTRSSKKGQRVPKSDISKVSKWNQLNRTVIDRANMIKTVTDSAT